MIVQDHPDGCLFGIVTVQGFQMFDELSAAMAVRHHPVNIAGEQIDAGQQTQGSKAFILIVASSLWVLGQYRELGGIGFPLFMK